jgi:ABC-type transport system involved in multi-copper enzyme maturation permease subunit
VASAAAKVRAIAWTAFQETLRRKVFYLVAFLTLLVIAGVASDSVTVHMATDAGETTMVSEVRTQSVVQILGIWQFAAGALALYLGAIGLSSEIAGKTLVNVMSRPVEAATYLAGRWIGVLGFLWAFLALGVGMAAISTYAFAVPHTPMLWMACAALFVNVLFFSGVSLGLSVVVPPIVAGVLALLLTFLPSMVEETLKHPSWTARALSYVAYYIAPASMPESLSGQSFSKELLHPAYGLYARILGENALYAIVVFAIGCALFARRETRMR